LCANQRKNMWLVKSHCFGAGGWLSLLLSHNYMYACKEKKSKKAHD